MLTSPFELNKHVKELAINFDPLPFIDICIIAFFLTLNSSRFLMAPGISISLPEIGSSSLTGSPIAAVMTVRENNSIIFEGEIFSIESLSNKLMTYLEESQIQRSTLLIKVDKNVSIQNLLKISNIARNAGFNNAQIAAIEVVDQEDIFNNNN